MPENNNNEDLAKVLIVDDNVFNIHILQMIFNKNHMLKADTAISGEEALM